MFTIPYKTGDNTHMHKLSVPANKQTINKKKQQNKNWEVKYLVDNFLQTVCQMPALNLAVPTRLQDKIMSGYRLCFAIVQCDPFHVYVNDNINST